MKTMKSLKRGKKRAEAARMGVVLLTMSVATGCTHQAAKRARVSKALAEESRALTTAVVEALQSQPALERDGYTTTALEFARQDQRVEGLPLRPFDVPALLAGIGLTNNFPPFAGPPAVEEAREEVAARFAQQGELMAKRAATEANLIDRGIDAEAVRNKRITRWTKFSAWGTTLIGGAVALFVFCPIALPICGRLLAWLVGKIPSLASAFGVVSVKAFDAVVRGIEKTKDSSKTNSPAAPTVPVANTSANTLLASRGDSRRGQESWLDQLHNNLSREMDAAHKALVRARKTQIA